MKLIKIPFNFRICLDIVPNDQPSFYRVSVVNVPIWTILIFFLDFSMMFETLLFFGSNNRSSVTPESNRHEKWNHKSKFYWNIGYKNEQALKKTKKNYINDQMFKMSSAFSGKQSDPIVELPINPITMHWKAVIIFSSILMIILYMK